MKLQYLILIAFAFVMGQAVYGQLPANHYYIDQTQTTPGAYPTIQDAMDAMDNGILGPVTFEIVDGSGPYFEEVTIEEIPGASGLNSVHIIGNDEIVGINPYSNRWGFKFDGADFVILEEVRVYPDIINYPTTAFGPIKAFYLTNGADHNQILNCETTINTSVSHNSGHALAIDATGGVAGDENKIRGCRFKGGNPAVYINGGNTQHAIGNIVEECEILDFIGRGVQMSRSELTEINYCDISREDPINTSAFQGIYLVATNYECTLNGNRIHHSHTNGFKSGYAYGIHLANSGNPAGRDHQVTNNLIYALDNERTAYGIYNQSSSGVNIYHNTIEMAATALTPNTNYDSYGLFFSGVQNDVEVKNNIVWVDRKGPGAGSEGVAFNITYSGANITHDHNNLLVGAGQLIGKMGYPSAPDLPTWQTMSGQAANSVSIDPDFVDALNGDLHPQEGTMDNLGAPVGVLVDADQVSRSTQDPDMGALEYGASCALLGNYTIDQGAMTSGTTYASFADAIAALYTCGVQGDVTLTVADGSGPYTLPFSLQEVPGAGPNAKITFDGNEETLQFGGTYGIWLDGADL